MQLHVETAMDRIVVVEKANQWIKANLKPGQFFNAVLNPLLQVTIDVKGKGRPFGKPETLTKRLVYDYSVLIYYFSEDEMTIPILPLPNEGTGTGVNTHSMSPIG